MSTTIQVIVRGLALCFYKNDVWNVVFVSDSVHPSAIMRPGDVTKGVEDFHVPGRDTELDFVGNIRKRLVSEMGQNSGLLFNLSEDYAHGTVDGPDGKPVSRLELFRQKDPSRDVIWMKVPDAVMSVQTLTLNEYYVQEQSFAGAPVSMIGRVAKDAVFTFSADGPVMMVLTDPNDPTFRQEMSTIPDQGETVKLLFDNDCKGGCNHNDFLDLYDIIRDVDVNDDGEEFEIRYAGGQIKQTMLNGRRTSATIGEGSGLLTTDSGNCEVIGSHPPPRP